VIPRWFLLALLLAACGPAQPMHGPSMNNRMGPAPAGSRVVSTAILDREPVASRTRVKHILIGWKDLEDSYGGGMDARAARRSKRDAEAQIESLLAQLRGGADFDALMQAHSEDSGLAAHPDGYPVSPDAQLVLDFRRLGLRLHLDEVGVVETQFGFHLMKRVE
jgi:peptidyl-prolyl cis-trans isomerase D